MPRTVLVVDDEADVATYLATILTANGYDPMMANDVETGLDMVKNHRPSLICLDIMMPRKSGAAMYVDLKGDPETRDIPVIIISGVGQGGRFDFRNWVPDESVNPPDAFMEKPVEIDAFLKTVGVLTGEGGTA